MKVDVLDTLERCQAYVDDAVGFPEQFKPGVVKRDQKQYAKSRDAIAELIAAVEERREMSKHGRHSTGPFAESDARIDAALLACKGQDHER